MDPTEKQSTEVSAPDQKETQELSQSSPALQGERVSFTGTLASMTHQQASQLAEEHGGTATTHVGKQTTMLVVGEEGWPLESDGRPSVKLQETAELLHAGLPVRVLQESEWLQLLDLSEPQQIARKLYTPAMLQKALDIPVSQIRTWERRGLIRAVKKVYRLPYFDFQQVSSVRRLMELLEAGVPRHEIEESLKKLEAIFPNLDRPLAQLDLLAQDHHLLFRDENGLVEPVSGQRFFEFPGKKESSDDSAEEEMVSLSISEENADQAGPQFSSNPEQLFQEACQAQDENQLDLALQMFRFAAQQNPTHAEIHFHLAEILYRLDNTAGAIERYHLVVELDPHYLEAWTQLGCLYAEQQSYDIAANYFQTALAIHPEYPDAIFHLAESLKRLNRLEDAAVRWQEYLQFDSRGPWAESARQALENWQQATPNVED